MKRNVLIVFVIILCLASLAALSSCSFILDYIFGPAPEPNHTHSMVSKTAEANCLGEAGMEYWYCEGCDKYFADENGQNEITDVDGLKEGHIYINEHDEVEHWTWCKFCNTLKGNKALHTSDKWSYDENGHYRQCTVCSAKYEADVHTMENGACSVCNYIVDYSQYCNSDYGYNQLATLENGEKMQRFYNALDEVLSDVHSNANVNADFVKNNNGGWYALEQINFVQYNLTQTQAFTVLSSYRNDHPLYYWISNSVLNASSTMGPIAIRVCVDEEYANGSARVEQNAKLYKAIGQYMQLVSDQDDAYEVAKIFHDRIIDDINYAYTDDGLPESARWAHSLIGVFEHKSAVCEGYAKAFQALLNAKGIQNVYVTGTSNGQGHAWNLVKLDNDGWYWYDLTWDDQPGMLNGRIYDYFCKIDADFKNHQISSDNEGLDYLYDLPARATNRYSILDL